MDISVLMQGLIIGFSIAAPVGPIGVLCIRRTLTDGRMAGLLSGLGAATADAVYGAIAGFGLSAISDLLISQQLWLRGIGGVFLIYLGARMFISKPAERAAEAQGSGLVGMYASTLFLTLTNPMTILFFGAVFVGLGASGARLDYWTAILLVAGVFIGSAVWWLILSVGVSLTRARFTTRNMRWVNRVAGAVIVGFGAISLLSVSGIGG